MEDGSSSSVYDLITSLCEKFTTSPNNVRKFRSLSYEILLGKKIPQQEKVFQDLQESNDPYCNLLAWEFILSNRFDLRKHAEQLKEYREYLVTCYESNIDSFNSILKFLLQLRNLPQNDDVNNTDLSTLPQFDDTDKFSKLFKMPQSLICDAAQYLEEPFYMKTFRKRHNTAPALLKESCTCPDTESKADCLTPRFSDLFQDEGYGSPTKSMTDNIWEVASKEHYSDRRNWESYGQAEPEKEPPFLSELGEMSSLWVENLQSLYFTKMFKDGVVLRSQMKARRDFVRDIKYLLVGLSSDSFNYNLDGDFYLIPGISLEGITPDSLAMYCKDMLFSASCYKALYEMSMPDFHTGKYRQDGYIFAELCASLGRYLLFHRTAVFSIPDSTSLLRLSEKTEQLRRQIETLASICKTGPYAEPEQVPHGVALLNYLYQQALSLTNKNVLMVLYSVLYPCCQVYFSRFLQQWLLEGELSDSYGEFLVRPNFKYISTRGRTYWTRSYALREDILPDFLIDLRTEILSCGKAMNLLKLCVPNNKLCLYLMSKKPLIVSCCLTPEQLVALDKNITGYYLEVSAECGSKISLSQTLSRSREQDPIFMNLVAKKRAVTLKRLELERQKTSEEKREKQLEEMAMLREQYNTALIMKQLRITMEIEKEMKSLEENLAFETMRDKLIEAEAKNMIEYYNSLYEISEKRKHKIDQHIEIMKIMTQSPLKLNKSETSIDSFHSANSDHLESMVESPTEEICFNDAKESPEIEKVHSSKSLDILNANASEENNENTRNMKSNENNTKTEKVKQDENTDKSQTVTRTGGGVTKPDNTISMALENFKAARRNKQKILTQEMGIQFNPMPISDVTRKFDTANLTQAQINKHRVLTQEMGIQFNPKPISDVTRKFDTANLTQAQINKHKVLTQEMGIQFNPMPCSDVTRKINTADLTQAQINKLKVLGTEFGMETNVSNKTKDIATVLTTLEINRNKIMGSNECFYGTEGHHMFDNVNFVNKNVVNEATKLMDDEDVKHVKDAKKEPLKKSISLQLDFIKPNSGRTSKPTVTDLDKPIPMSVDSTPLSDFPQSQSSVTTPASSMFRSIEKGQFDSCPTTAGTHVTDEGFEFHNGKQENTSYTIYVPPKSGISTTKPVFSKRVTPEEACGLSTNCLKLFLHESVARPVLAQSRLVNNELLKYFVEDLGYLRHLVTLRDYFFLQDGEFGRNMTENLFEKLYEANCTTELINFRTLQCLVFNALDTSSKPSENYSCLSFKINDTPRCFDLGDPDVLDCLSLTYKVHWPLNILLPVDTISKYDEIFKYLMKLNRMAWVLKKIVLELKILAKQTGKKEIYLMSSPHYRRIHQCRHVMMHFVQTLQNYIVGEVLQSSWQTFEKNLENVTNLDELYNTHTVYIKNILFMCLLNQRTVQIRKVIHKIFVVILKFYDYLRSRCWTCQNGAYEHPNFVKLESIFKNFEEIVLYLFKVGRKVAKSGYQPHLIQLLDMLDINGYYSKGIND